MDKTEVARGVAERLFAAEHSIDKTFASLAALAAYLPEARAQADLSLKIGAEPMRLVAEAMAQVAAARETLAQAHDKFAVAQRAIGDRTVMTGGGSKPPPGIEQLREVRAA